MGRARDADRPRALRSEQGPGYDRRSGRCAMNRRVLRLVAYPTVLLAALGVAYLATRDDNVTTAARAAHDHGAAAGAAAGAKPVRLTDADARRIRVTFATARSEERRVGKRGGAL